MVVGADGSIVLLNLVPSGDTEVASALANKGGNVGSGEEDQGDREVLDEGNVEAVLAAELDVGALEEVKCGSIEPALCERISILLEYNMFARIELTLGYGKEKTTFETRGDFTSASAHSEGGMSRVRRALPNPSQRERPTC